MAELVGNLLVGQSGGPTSAINASLSGVIQEAGRHECIEEIYGAANGILGVLNEDFIDINEQKAKTIEGLKYTPGAALGTCRYKINFAKNPEKAAQDMERVFEVFQAHNIRYFFYIGGNDSQDTANKIHEEAVRRGYELRVIGVPKTIDNDLPHTDNCPGYGSVTIVRDGSRRDVTVKLDEASAEKVARRGESDSTPEDKAALGVSVAPLTPDLATRFNLPKTARGVVVQEVTPDGRAADAGIQAGDLIEQVNRTPVNSVEELRSAVRRTSDRPLLLLVNREGRNIFVTVRPGA